MTVQMSYVVEYTPRGGKTRFVKVGFSTKSPRDPSEEGVCVIGYDASLPRMNLAEFKRTSRDLPSDFVSMVEEMLKRPPKGRWVRLKKSVKGRTTKITITVRS